VKAAAVTLAIAASLALGGCRGGGDPAPDVDESGASAPPAAVKKAIKMSPPAPAGMRAYIDPETGEFTDEPPPGTPPLPPPPVDEDGEPRIPRQY
jgi:hypothetical protein